MARRTKKQFNINTLAWMMTALSWHSIANADATSPQRNDGALQLQSSTVTGEAIEGQQTVGYQVKNSTAGTKTSTPLSETPRSVSVVTRQRIQDQSSQTLTDILGYVPGIFAPPFAVGDGIAGDLFSIRGYNATD